MRSKSSSSQKLRGSFTREAEAEMADILIRNGFIATMDRQRTVYRFFQDHPDQRKAWEQKASYMR